MALSCGVALPTENGMVGHRSVRLPAYQMRTGASVLFHTLLLHSYASTEHTPSATLGSRSDARKAPRPLKWRANPHIRRLYLPLQAARLVQASDK
jgi:hypothetical protein